MRLLLTRGERVAATTRSSDRLLAGLTGVPTAQLLPLEVDRTDPDAVTAAVTSTVDRFGRLDVVVNNAGYGFLAPVEETDDSEVQRMLDVQAAASGTSCGRPCHCCGPRATATCSTCPPSWD